MNAGSSRAHGGRDARELPGNSSIHSPLDQLVLVLGRQIPISHGLAAPDDLDAVGTRDRTLAKRYGIRFRMYGRGAKADEQVGHAMVPEPNSPMKVGHLLDQDFFHPRFRSGQAAASVQ